MYDDRRKTCSIIMKKSLHNIVHGINDELKKIKRKLKVRHKKKKKLY